MPLSLSGQDRLAVSERLEQSLLSSLVTTDAQSLEQLQLWAYSGLLIDDAGWQHWLDDAQQETDGSAEKVLLVVAERCEALTSLPYHDRREDAVWQILRRCPAGRAVIAFLWDTPEAFLDTPGPIF